MDSVNEDYLDANVEHLKSLLERKVALEKEIEIYKEAVVKEMERLGKSAHKCSECSITVSRSKTYTVVPQLKNADSTLYEKIVETKVSSPKVKEAMAMGYFTGMEDFIVEKFSKPTIRFNK